VIEMFKPWLDPSFPNPAAPGELRWVLSDADGKDLWVDGPDDTRVNLEGRTVYPTSRTYIPAQVSDNPDYAASDYQRTLDAMPEPWRSLLLGGFRTEFQDAANQVIPTAWVSAAQARWTPQPPDNVPMSAMGVDATGGGTDPMVIAIRHDGWFAPLVEIPAKDIPIERAGPTAAGAVIAHRRGDALVTIDMSGGYGTAMYGHLHANGVEVSAYKGSEKAIGKTRDGKLGFYNTRSKAIWMMREALDPAQPGGSRIALPPDPKLTADLTAPTLDMEFNGIKVESKEKVCERLGRSTDRGDAVVMAYYRGMRMENVPGGFPNRNRAPQVIIGRPGATRRR
jgi:hypothetical protein